MAKDKSPVEGMTEETEVAQEASVAKKSTSGGLTATTRFYLEHGYNRYFEEGEAMPADINEKADGKLLDVLKKQGVVA